MADETETVADSERSHQAPDASAGRRSVWHLLVTFLRVGALSFGGGSATLALLHHEVVVRARWLSASQFSFTMALSRMHPGVHLLAQAVLIGYLVRKTLGASVALLGMLLPASAITLLFTVGFVHINENPFGRTVVASVVPAAAGLTLAVAAQLGREQLRGKGRGYRLVGIALAIGSFAAVVLGGVDTALVVLITGIVGALVVREDEDL